MQKMIVIEVIIYWLRVKIVKINETLERRWSRKNYECGRRGVCRIGCTATPARGAALAIFFSFCVRLFLAARVNLGFFHSEALHVRAQVSDSRRASPHSARPNFLHSDVVRSFRRSHSRVRLPAVRSYAAVFEILRTVHSAPRPAPARAAVCGSEDSARARC